MCTDPYQWWATSIRSDKYTDHRLSVNLHDYPAANGSVVDDEWCVLVRWARVNADHWTRAFRAYRNRRGSICVDIDVYSKRTQVARMETGYCAHSLAASQNGKWVAAGAEWEMLV